MKNISSLRSVGLSASLVVACALIGCQRKNDPSAELDKAARTMQATEAAPTPARASQPQLAPAPSPAQEMNQAVAAYKAGQVEDAVTRLQQLRATPTLSPQQRIALNDAMASVMSEVCTLAAKGDPRAIQALKQYDKMQMQSQH
jgi:hypothetical protein